MVRKLLSLIFILSLPVAAIAAQPRKNGPAFNQPATGDALAQLGAVLRNMNSSVLVVGVPGGGAGTAWVLSQKHRLLATNAHVADVVYGSLDKAEAIVNGETTRFKIERIYYHPGVRRHLQKQLVTWSEDPEDGDVVPTSADVAVLELAPGPKLPPEFKLAEPGELQELLGQPIGLFGFPGHDTTHLPQGSEKANATYLTGVISRLTDFNGQRPDDWQFRQFLQHTAQTWGGHSGSPMFLPNGRVIGLHNSGRRAEDNRGNTKLVMKVNHGVRVDCLWELLVHHKLDDKIGLNDRQRDVHIARYLQPPSDAERTFREALLLVDQGYEAFDRREYVEGLQLCNKADRLVDDFPRLRFVRAANYVGFVDDNWDRLKTETLLKYLQYAINDAERLGELAPSDPYAPLLFVAIANRMAEVKEDRKTWKSARRDLDHWLQLLANGYAAEDRWKVLVLCESGYSHLLDEDAVSAVENFNDAIDVMPNWYVPYQYRAEFWEAVGRDERARADRQKAEQLLSAARSK